MGIERGAVNNSVPAHSATSGGKSSKSPLQSMSGRVSTALVPGTSGVLTAGGATASLLEYSKSFRHWPRHPPCSNSRHLSYQIDARFEHGSLISDRDH